MFFPVCSICDYGQNLVFARPTLTQINRAQIKGRNKKAKNRSQFILTRRPKKEQKEINKELREAGAEVDQEERKTVQTETLKLLFALYFRILKNPTPTPLLPSALSGISKFAHLVNIDFFKDLMRVLKDLISIKEEAEEDVSEGGDRASREPLPTFQGVLLKLMCIVTAFELLSGQGEALNIDLDEFITSLYAMLLQLSFSTEIDAHIVPNSSSSSQSIIDIVFRALNLIFSPRTSGMTAPPWRSAAFSKRLLTVSLHWPPAGILRALEFVRGLVAKDPKLEAMLATEDRIFNGVYHADVDDPQLSHPFQSSFWELHVLHRRHWDPRVREEAGKLLNCST